MASRVVPRSPVVRLLTASFPFRKCVLLTFGFAYLFLLFPTAPIHFCPCRMFPQQINTTFDTSLLCPQRNRINSIPGPWLATSGLVMVSKVLGLRSLVLRIQIRIRIRIRTRRTFPKTPSLHPTAPVHCSSLRAPRLKAACPVDTFA